MPSRKYVTLVLGHDMSEQINIAVSMPKMRHLTQIISKRMGKAIDKKKSAKTRFVYLGLDRIV